MTFIKDNCFQAENREGKNLKFFLFQILNLFFYTFAVINWPRDYAFWFKLHPPRTVYPCSKIIILVLQKRTTHHLFYNLTPEIMWEHSFFALLRTVTTQRYPP